MKNKIEPKDINIFCKKTDPSILEVYFRSQGLDVTFDKTNIKVEDIKSEVSKSNDKNKAKILSDFNKVRFFIKNTDSFSYLVRYIQDMKQTELSILEDKDSIYDKVVYIY